MSDAERYCKRKGDGGECLFPACNCGAAERERARYKAALEMIADRRSRQWDAGDIAREALAPSEAEQAATWEDDDGATHHATCDGAHCDGCSEQAAAEAAGPEPGLAAPSVAGYPGLLEDGVATSPSFITGGVYCQCFNGGYDPRTSARLDCRFADEHAAGLNAAAARSAEHEVAQGPGTVE